jgi:hypothetical protein
MYRPECPADSRARKLKCSSALGLAPGETIHIFQELGERRMNGDVHLRLEPFESLLVSFGREYYVNLLAQCWLPPDTNVQSAPHTCDAFADPYIRFDEAKFNVMYGPNAFATYGKYMNIQLSPGISNNPRTVVPEPGTGLMLAAAVLMYATFKRRRRVSRLN